MASRFLRKPARAVSKDDAIPSLKPTPIDAGTVEFFDAEEYPQGGEEWFNLHLGIPTASIFGAIMAGGDQRRDLLYLLAGEEITRQPRSTYSNKFMERGHEMEPEARQHYAFTRQVELEQLGFVRRTFPRDRTVGCSPDAKINGKKAGLEIKTMSPHLLIQLLESGRTPTEHRAQCQGTLWVTGWEWIDLLIFYRGMPVSPSWRFERDEAYMRQLADAVEVFQHDLKDVVERTRSRGKR